MNSSYITTEIHNKLVNSSDPEVREIGRLMQAMMKLMQDEIDALKKRVAALEYQKRR